MSNVLSKVAAAAALLGAASASHAFILYNVSQNGGGIAADNENYSCRSDTFGGCGTFLTSFTIAGRTTSVFSLADGSSFRVEKGGGLADTITFSGQVGDYSINSTNGTSNTPGTATEARTTTSSLDVRRVTAAGGGGAELFIGIQAFNFTQPDGVIKTLFGSSSISSTSAGSGSISASFWADKDNEGKKDTPTIGCSYTLVPDASCSTSTLVWNDPAPGVGDPSYFSMFSLRSEHTFKLTNGSFFTGTTSLTAALPVPAPATLSLVGVALLAAGAVARRRSA